MAVLGVQTLKERYLHGVDTRDRNGVELHDRVYEFYIKKAVSWLEHYLDIYIEPTKTVELHDFNFEEYRNWGFIKLYRYPILKFLKFQAVYPDTTTVVEFPLEWLSRTSQYETGQIQIVPGTGAATQFIIGQGGPLVPLIFRRGAYLPKLFQIDFVAGFLPCGTSQKVGVDPNNPATGPVALPVFLQDLIGMKAAISIMNIAGDLVVGAGITSRSIGFDGYSESLSTTASSQAGAYGGRINQYKEEMKESLALAKDYYKGVRLTVA